MCRYLCTYTWNWSSFALFLPSWGLSCCQKKRKIKPSLIFVVSLAYVFSVICRTKYLLFYIFLLWINMCLQASNVYFWKQSTNKCKTERKQKMLKELSMCWNSWLELYILCSLKMYETTCQKEPKCIVSIWLQWIFLLVKQEPNSARLLALSMFVFPSGLTEWKSDRTCCGEKETDWKHCEHEKSFVPAEHYSLEAKGLYSSVTHWVFVNNQYSAPMEPKSGQTAWSFFCITLVQFRSENIALTMNRLILWKRKCSQGCLHRCNLSSWNIEFKWIQ